MTEIDLVFKLKATPLPRAGSALLAPHGLGSEEHQLDSRDEGCKRYRFSSIRILTLYIFIVILLL